MRTIQIAEAFVAIRPDSKGFKAEVERDVETPLKNVKSLVAGLAVGAAAISFVKGGLDELKEQQQVLALTDATLKATGHSANVTADEISNLAEQTQAKTGKDKEAVQAGENMLLQFRDVRNELGAGNDIFNRASELAVDLSVATGRDLSSAYQTLGRALEDPLQGTRALRSANIILDESQKEQIKRLVEQGDKLGAQRYILDLLAKQVGGVGEAYGQTLPGKLERAKNAFDDVKASVVGSAAPALESAATVATDVANAFTKLPQPLQTGILLFGAMAVAAKPASTALTGAKTVLSGMGALFDKAATGAYDFAGRGLGSIALQGAAATAVVAGLAVGIQKWQADMEAAEKAGTDTAKAIADRSAKDSLEGVEARLGRITTAMGDLKRESDDWHGSKNPLDLVDADYIAQLDAYNNKLGYQSAILAGQVEAAKQLAAAKGISVEAAWREIQASQKTKEAHDDEKASTDKVADAYKRQQDALEKLASAKKSQYDAIVALGSDASAYDAAKAGVDAARAKVAAMSPADPGYAAAVKELSDAIEKQAQARVKVAETQAKANGVELDAATAARLHRDELEKLSAGMPKVQEQLAGLVFLLDNLAKDRTASVHVEVSGVDELMAQLYKAQYELELMRKEAAGMSKEEAFATTPWPGTPRATGGPARAGGIYTVGEYGKETFVPDTAGMILPADAQVVQAEDGSYLVLRNGPTGRYNDVALAQRYNAAIRGAAPSPRASGAVDSVTSTRTTDGDITVNAYFYGHQESSDEMLRNFSMRVGQLVGGAQR